MKCTQIRPEGMWSYLQSWEWNLQQMVKGTRARLVVQKGTVEVIGANGEPLEPVLENPAVNNIRIIGERLTLSWPKRIEVEGVIAGARWWIYDMPAFEVAHYSPAPSAWTWNVRSAVLRGLFYELILPGAVCCKTCRDQVVGIVETCATASVKVAAWKKILRSKSGAILKHVDGLITDGVASKDVLKVDLDPTIYCTVMARGPGNGKPKTGASRWTQDGNWIALGLRREDGTIYEAGLCSKVGKPFVLVDDVVEVRCKDVAPGGRLVLPEMLRVRRDKDITDCTDAQLAFVGDEVATLD